MPQNTLFHKIVFIKIALNLYLYIENISLEQVDIIQQNWDTILRVYFGFSRYKICFTKFGQILRRKCLLECLRKVSQFFWLDFAERIGYI